MHILKTHYLRLYPPNLFPVVALSGHNWESIPGKVQHFQTHILCDVNSDLVDALDLILLYKGIHHSKRLGTARVDMWGSQISLKFLLFCLTQMATGPSFRY